jgi:uncharacterized membrane protein YdjX (TVP38/TMEM64 family)
LSSLSISAIISLFVFRELAFCFILAFILSYYFKIPKFKVIFITFVFSLAFESLLYQIKTFDLKDAYFYIFLSLTLGFASTFIKNPLIISSIFGISYLLGRFSKIIVILATFTVAYYFEPIRKLLFFLFFLFFSLPFVSYNSKYYSNADNQFDLLKFENGLLLLSIFLKNYYDYIIAGILYFVLSFLPHKKLLKFIPHYYSVLAFYLLNGLIISIPFFFINYHITGFQIMILKKALLAIGIILLHIVQIVIAFIPGHFVPFTAGLVFGLWGVVIDGIGMILGSVIAYALGRKFGETIVLKFVDKEKLTKFSDFINQKGAIGLYLLFILPFTPKDALCFISGLLKIRFLYFLFIVIFIRVPADGLIVLIGAGFKHLSSAKITIYLAVLGFVAFIILLIISNIKERKKTHTK